MSFAMPPYGRWIRSTLRPEDSDAAVSFRLTPIQNPRRYIGCNRHLAVGRGVKIDIEDARGP